VDDWDKSASFVVAATPRRSTSSLDEVSAVARQSAKKITILGRCVVILAAISWGCFFELYIYLDYTRPHVIDVAAGRIYVLNNHGSMAFLTRGEQIFLYSFEYAAIGLFIVAAFLQYRMRRASSGVPGE
jgi:hypothetical protein